MRVAVIPNLEKENTADILVRLSAVLEQYHITPLLPSSVPGFENLRYLRLEEKDVFASSDVVVAVGGDGTIIHTAKKAAEYGKPVLGINAGRLGFMAGLESDELDRLELLTSGSYTTESRMLLKAEIHGTDSHSFYCLNDAVISKGSLSRMIDIAVDCKGELITYRADGLIVSTPTGSTAYSMSAGGPVLDPSIESIMITPICPHSLFSRSVLLNPAAHVKITASGMPGTHVYLTIDGEEAYLLERDTEVIVSKAADRTVKLIKMKDDTFYKVLSKKLR